MHWNFAVGTDLAHIVGKSVVAAKRHRALGTLIFASASSWRLARSAAPNAVRN
jgi:hypothetical protein